VHFCEQTAASEFGQGHSTGSESLPRYPVLYSSTTKSTKFSTRGRYDRIKILECLHGGRRSQFSVLTGGCVVLTFLLSRIVRPYCTYDWEKITDIETVTFR